MPNILIHGAGAIGGVYAHILNLSPSEQDIALSLTARSNYDVLATSGIYLTSSIFGNHHFRPHVIRAADLGPVSPVNSKPWDFIIVTTKAFPAAAESIKPAVSAGTTIALFQNGIGIEEQYKVLYPLNPLLSVVVIVPATITAPGHILHGPAERLQLGTYPAMATAEAEAQAVQLADLLRSGGATVEIHGDVQRARWEKLAVNAVWNPICAITRLSSHNAAATEENATLLRSTFQEIVSVANAAGYTDISMDLYHRNLERVATRSGTKEPSMLLDVRDGKELEIWAILGNVIAIAAKLGVDVPNLRILNTLCSMINQSIRHGTQDQSTERAAASKLGQ